MAAQRTENGSARKPSSFAEAFYARTDHDSTFLVELDHEHGTRREWTVGAWRDRVTATAAWLGDRGIREGDSVATLAGNTADALAVAYACWVAGACCVPLNPHETAEQHEYILHDASAAVLVYSPSVRERPPGPPARAVPVTDLPLREPDRARQAGARRQTPEVGAAPLDAEALRVYTSGTTGAPKGVVLSAANILADCEALARGLGWSRSTRILTVLPIHHVNGLIISSLLPWLSGLSTVLCDRFRSDTFWRDADAEGATVCSLVPSLLEFLLDTGGGAPTGFDEVLCGAGPLLVDTVLAFEERFGVPVRHLYGLSETTAVATLMPRLPEQQRRTWHQDLGFPSIGPALPWLEVRVTDQQGVPLPAGERGELAIRGPVVMSGYAGNPDATARAFHGEWFRSGDEGFWHPGPDGLPYFFITGRLKELIIRGGVNVSPFEVDDVLHSHPAVRHGLAFPFDNRYYGEEIAAYVVLHDGSQVREDDILAHCRSRLDHAKCPKLVVFGEDVPYTATGKAKRLELARELAPTLAEYRDVRFRREPQPEHR
ncbi:class I adenylate-forming enzyme family protein [Haloechinothrix sp. LS1_15]|uniref:class I adenylate-forming enzyme family protein n=1 Tax=Haloechinothrix sp. LS1_15 TaxID=2652248 RepID=UPI0029462332|nr:class I adenylate-forming enzyme family protein [Haloechinothrix sp. LS1_15]MDV6010946.1 acyl--CoA ligase [Haloechinothrix sp. LS1_15]